MMSNDEDGMGSGATVNAPPAPEDPAVARRAARQAARDEARRAAEAAASGTTGPSGGTPGATQQLTQTDEPSGGGGRARVGRGLGEAGVGQAEQQASQSFARVGGKEATQRGYQGAVFSPHSLFSGPGGANQMRSRGGAMAPLAQGRGRMIIGGSPSGPSGPLGAETGGFFGRGAFDEGQQPGQMQQMMSQMFQ